MMKIGLLKNAVRRCFQELLKAGLAGESNAGTGYLYKMQLWLGHNA